MARDFAKKLYKSKEWKQIRALVFNEANGICEKCGEPGEEVHHKVWLTQDNINDYDIALGRDNLILLCKDCHAKEHRSNKEVNSGFKFDANGDFVPIK